MDFINTFIGIPLGYLMWFCYELVGRYGLAILLFTMLTKLIVFPINIWVQKNSIKMVKLQPQVNNIIAKYVGDRDTAAEKQMALYKKEKYRPMAGMLPMLIQIPIILGLISVVYNPLQHLLHMDQNIISAFVEQAETLYGSPLGSTAQLKIIEYINDPATVGAFASLPVTGVGDAITCIQSMDLQFFGLNLAQSPHLFSPDIYWLFPILSGLSAFLLCLFQNKENVLQKEQGFVGKWGMTIFLTAFSTYFAFIVPAGVGFYWIIGNIIAIITIYILNWMYDPKKFIDYDELERSKKRLAESKAIEKSLKPTKEQKARGKIDYKRFCDDINNKKHLVYYSEKSGFYKYFENQLDYIIKNSDINVHYITSDPNDPILEKNDPRIIPYYVDDTHLIPLFMKMDTDVMVSTTQSLQTYHLKRSLVRKDVKYIYTPHDPLSTHMGAVKGALDHFDTVLCVGQHQINEIRETEKVFKLKEKELVPCGYALIDNLIDSYEKMEHTDTFKKKILIAPSWQKDNILDSCIDSLLEALLKGDYDITLRPHPEYIKRYPVKMKALITKYESRFSDHFRIETDFSSNVTIFTADLVVTDWSGIAFEFSYATKKPCLFINTPMKIMNDEYDKISCVPIEISLRDKIGISLETDKTSEADQAVASLLSDSTAYKDSILSVMDETLFNVGHSAEVAAGYIIGSVKQ